MTGMTNSLDGGHSHVFLGTGHAQNERRTWGVILLCSAMMALEIGGGSLFGSLALIADGLHMSTHVLALLIAAIAYTYARRHAENPAFAFGTGKLGDLAGFSSALILAMIALLIGYEAVSRLFQPVRIDFNQAIPIAVLGLMVNLASAWMLGGGDHGHAHGHHYGHGAEDVRRIDTPAGPMLLEIFEDGVPPRFRIRLAAGDADRLTVETERPGGERQLFRFADRGGYVESLDEIPEPHAFTARIRLGDEELASLDFAEHVHGDAAHRDNNLRAAFIHVLADAAVSVLAILGLLSGKLFGWAFMDPVMGIVGMAVIANWSWGLARQTGSVLLDMTPDRAMAASIRREIEGAGDRITDLHLWRLGPGHLGAIVAVDTAQARDVAFYRERLGRYGALSHLTVEVRARRAAE